MTLDIETLFKDRTFAQFRDSPHIQDLIETLSDPMQDSSDVADFILGSLNIDDAEGEQLDYLGERIGVSRPPAQETRIFRMVRLGEVGDPDEGFSDDENPGGYMTTLEGLESISAPGTDMSDEDYRFLIRQKAASYRKKATREILFSYLLAFGARCKIDDDTDLKIDIDQDRYDDLDNWARNYIETRGFKPAGIAIKILETSRHKDSI
jgi:hypothetical protein